MKKITLLATFCFLLLSIIVKAQTPPNAFNYSAVARNPTGQPIATTTIGIQITILKTSPTGESQYSENHFVNTDAFGLFNLVIGAGAVQSGSMSSIDWSNDDYYLKVGMDAAGGTNFLTMGTTQLLSVPYALYAKSAGSISNQNSNPTMFSIYGEGQLASAVSQQIILNNNSNNYNPNNNYDINSGSYTVPQNGTYLFTLYISGAGTTVIKKNGVDQLLLPGLTSSTSLAYSSTRTVYITGLIAGDLITFWAEGWSDLGGPYQNFVGRIFGYKVE